MTDAVIVSLVAAAASSFAAWMGYRARETAKQNLTVANETKVIAEATRSMADGRLTDMTRQVAELTTKLATAEGTNAKLIAQEVGKASESLISRAQTAAVTVTSVAEAAADALLKKAEVKAGEIIAEALRESKELPRRRGRR
jgi:cell division septum initiation protein DivIVA